MRCLAFATVCWLAATALGADDWRQLPLITDGQVNQDWQHIGWGGFAVEDGSLRTACDQKGMGLLLYTPEKFGDCQIRVVYKTKDAHSNAGVFVRIDEKILERLDEKAPAAKRSASGELTEESFANFQQSSSEEIGPWFPVHHGYEVQICDQGGEYNRTGSVYSLSRSQPLPKKNEGEWRTMIITLKGERILVDIDGQRISQFDPTVDDVPSEREWYEPKREPKRPTSGYIGLQNHDPGDVVYFKEVSVRPLPRE